MHVVRMNDRDGEIIILLHNWIREDSIHEYK